MRLVEKVADHVVAPELDGKVQRSRVAVGARINVHPGVEEVVDDGAAIVQGGEHEGLADDLARVVGRRSAWRAGWIRSSVLEGIRTSFWYLRSRSRLRRVAEESSPRRVHS